MSTVYDTEDRLREIFRPPVYSMLPSTRAEADLWRKPFEGRLWTIRQKYPDGWSIVIVATTAELEAGYLNKKPQRPKPQAPQATTYQGPTDEATVRAMLPPASFLAPDRDNPGTFVVKDWKSESILVRGSLASIAAHYGDRQLC